MNPKIQIESAGQTFEYDVILTFENENNHNTYIVYTDNVLDADGDLRIYASIYDPLEEIIIGEVNTPEEWTVINQVLSQVMDK